MATGYYLRDSSTTNFVNLYDWTDAAAGRYTPLDADFSKADRVRMIQLLINDTYWSNINSVYASGQGEVSMAFIKDDIGNWNLKSFENNPAELLNAYDNLARSSVRAAVRLARAASGDGIGTSKELLQLADIAVSGHTPGEVTLGGGKLTEFRKNILDRIDNRQSQFTQAADSVNGEITAKSSEVSQNSLSKALLLSHKRTKLAVLDSEITNTVDTLKSEAGCNTTGENEREGEGENEERAESTPARDKACNLPSSDEPEAVCNSGFKNGSLNLATLCERREPISMSIGSLEGSTTLDTNQVTEVCALNAPSGSSVAQQCTELAAIKERQKSIRKDAIAEIERIVADHKAVVNALSLSATQPAS